MIDLSGSAMSCGDEHIPKEHARSATPLKAAQVKNCAVVCDRISPSVTPLPRPSETWRMHLSNP
ncbi:hypothetical protein CERSUDRAFT_116734 [Gelatoporia subvermispora B]|uniref:Uncharacterized protein n=1 Tax=Ceriporiopsis subvermispora (strain B) TaxID=914234 RepID=M2R811_CERS8|nr:hypothetical protein CERSUDRAFT_116734 [Gelatoporia subvermispora B]